MFGLRAVAWWLGRGEQGAVAPPPSDNFLGALKFVIANVKYYTKDVKSNLSTNSKIVVILAMNPLLPFLGAQKPEMSVSC